MDQTSPPLEMKPTRSLHDGFLQVALSLASLRLTVSLLALSIVLILASTFAQVEADIWEVVHTYFRTWFTAIPFQIFLPRAFFADGKPWNVPGSFYWPGGYLLGLMLAINLLAAHWLRFKIQARGMMLMGGLCVLVIGILLTAGVIVGSSNRQGFQEDQWVSYRSLWQGTRFLVGALALGQLAFWLSSKFQSIVASRILIVSCLLSLACTAWLFTAGSKFELGDSSMRVLWQIAKGGASGLVLLVACLMLFGKRGGVVLLHGGIGLMMFGELLVGLTAVEAQAHIQEGETVNFVQDIRTVELAIIEPLAGNEERVTVIPRHRLMNAGKSPISSKELPFDVVVNDFFKNTSIAKVTPQEAAPATIGIAATEGWKAENKAPASGVGENGVDVSSIYVTLKSKSDRKTIGTFLLINQPIPYPIGPNGSIIPMTRWRFADPESFDFDGKTWQVALRFQRHYKPYHLTLKDVRNDVYVGTNTPRNYSSDVRLVDTSRSVDRDVHIWMNNPLRFAGETFYQSGFRRDPILGKEVTTLQVVTNTGWMIPYVSCMLVSWGMLAHFCGSLFRFLNRFERSALATLDPASNGSRDSIMNWVIPLVAVAICGFWALKQALPAAPKPDEFDLYGFGRIPIVYQGRTKPIDTLARNTVVAISHRQEVEVDETKMIPAIRWMLDVLIKPDTAAEYHVFKIESLELLDKMGLARRKHFRYSANEIGDGLPKLAKDFERLQSLDSKDLKSYDKKLREFTSKLTTYRTVASSFAPPALDQSSSENLLASVRKGIGMQMQLQQDGAPRLMPPDPNAGKDSKDPFGTDDDWTTFGLAWTKNLVRDVIGQPKDELVDSFTRILVAYSKNDVKEFNGEVANYHKLLKERKPTEYDAVRIDFESYFNMFLPFYVAAALYVIAFALSAAGWLVWTRAFNRAASGVIGVALIVHTFGLIARMYISGRPPITNLYTTAIFIGWGCAITGVILEMIYKLGVGNTVASVAGFVTLVIAHYLGIDGDTFTVLQAVLDTQFWLATHVVAINFGYATTYLAGLFGLVYILRGVLTPTMTPAIGKEISRMTYGAMCFAVFFSLVGTVLGGLWADDSWGRFWGWDPKENGALILVLWQAIALHARWGGMVRDRGFALLAIAANIAVSWSWFGVNELGAGLHAYGFREGVLRNLAIIIATHLLVITIGLLPLKYWWSNQARPAGDSR